MMDVGRVCLKIAGRDAGKYCVIVEPAKDSFCLIDGQVKRKRCNIRHLEPTQQILSLKEGASHAAVKDAFASIGIMIQDHVAKEPAAAPPHEPKKEAPKTPSPKEKKAAKKEKKAPAKKSKSKASHA